MMGKMRLLPGATGSNATKRDGYDAGAKAAMTVDEFERWFVRAICQYHNAPHAALGGLAPAQVWAHEAMLAGPLLPPGLDGQLLARRFLPWVERTVKAYGIQIGYRRYWHPCLAPHIGQKIMVHYDERILHEVYPEVEGAFVEARVIGDYPDVSGIEWEMARKQLRDAGRAFQEGSARAETARLIHANHTEILAAQVKTKQARVARKRQEREGISHAHRAEPENAIPAASWVSVAELGAIKWLKPM